MNQRVCKIFLSLTVAMSCLFGSSISASAGQKVLYITFDDGPSERYTPQILAILQRKHVHATFFVLGFRAKQYPLLVRRMLVEGHEIGNHGYYHQIIVNKNDDWVQKDLKRSAEVIRKASGVNPILYRPPGGIINQQEMAAIERAGHPVVLWTVDSQDWKTASTDDIVENVMSRVQPGAIVLFHDGVSNSRYTAEALPTIIQKCRAQGFTFKILPTHG